MVLGDCRVLLKVLELVLETSLEVLEVLDSNRSWRWSPIFWMWTWESM